MCSGCVLVSSYYEKEMRKYMILILRSNIESIRELIPQLGWNLVKTPNIWTFWMLGKVKLTKLPMKISDIGLLKLIKDLIIFMRLI